MKEKSFSIRARIKSFSYAIQGIATLLKSEHNAWIHLLATAVVITAGALLKVSSQEWIFIVFAIGFVFSAEAFNSAIEYLADRISEEHDERIKKAKDVAAAAVLFAAISAAVIGLIIFVPKIINIC
ncbi:diacylglycerol kinase family protein [Porphyromonadaceae bacterium OttesenSCG-928-L07]|nr:diacylglycerol kinase family protein [Porphyromonadaceae bacterium OttesenSCG-928-L07]MDL2331147.1 diacylglycerol kinase family protein [Odoribacter sp. OttesenSCG-928-A06]